MTVSRFSIGDHVRVITRRHDFKGFLPQFGGVGFVEDFNPSSSVPIGVRFEKGWWQPRNSYTDDDLELVGLPTIIGDDDSDCI